MKYIEYENARKYLKDKNKNVNSYIDYMLARTNEMFIYKGLPKTIPAKNLEFLLQKNGFAFITKAPDGNLYAFNGGLGGEPNAYGEPTRFIISNPALKFNKDCEINKDGVLMENDSRVIGLIPMLSKYGAMLCDSEISLNMISVLMRVCYLVSACDDKSKASADQFIEKIVNGDFSVIGDSAFFEGVKLQNAQGSNSQLITQFIELNQYIKATAFNEIGLNANFNMKRERLTAGEVELNNDSLLPFIQNMLSSRRAAIEKINKMFDTDIIVDLAGVWKAEREQLEQASESIITDSIADVENAPAEIGGKSDVESIKNTISSDEKAAGEDSKISMEVSNADSESDNKSDKEETPAEETEPRPADKADGDGESADDKNKKD